MIVAKLPSYSDCLFEDEREFIPRYVFLELVKAGQHQSQLLFVIDTPHVA
jgi:hypothetical protein